MTSSLSSQQVSQLLESAKNAARQAYAPYSDFPVGAALLTQSGAIITGVNIENASYGLTLCAERCAIATAVSQGERTFTAIAVWSERRTHGAITPCGACRQVLAEFLKPDALIIMADARTGQPNPISLERLLPGAFGLAQDGSCPDTSSN
jgi:cytidine deaminase